MYNLPFGDMISYAFKQTIKYKEDSKSQTIASTSLYAAYYII